MQEFKLPCLSAETLVRDAFAPMIEARVSGLVVSNGREYRLLHFAQLQAAWAHQLPTLGDIPGLVSLETGPLRPSILALEAAGTDGPTARVTSFRLGAEFFLMDVSADSKVVELCSRRELGAGMYLATNPGYSCNGPIIHYYPPNTRGQDTDCVVLGCPGHIP